MLKGKKIVITIPALNEEDSIKKVILDINTELETKFDNYLIQVLDDGSVDNTAKIAKEAGATVYSHTVNFGLAKTFNDEIKYALINGADIIVHTDADGQYLAEDISKLLDPILNNEVDLVLGSRFMGFIEEMPWSKRIGNKLFSYVISKICKKKIVDGQTGFRAFTREVAETVIIKSKFTYTNEQIIKAVENNFRIKEIPITFLKRNFGDSRLMTNAFNYAIRGGINLLRIYRDFAPLRFFGTIGSIFIATGIILLISGFLIFNKFFDTTFVIFVISGLQVLIFGFIAEMIKE